MIDSRFVALESAAGAFIRSARLDLVLRRFSRTNVPIIMYHSICADSASPDLCLSLAGMTVRESRFREHMEYIARYYSSISLTDYVNWRDGLASLPENPCVITFDDGFADTHQRAVPILRDLGLKATVFVIGSCLDVPGSVQPAGSWLHEFYAILDFAGVERCHHAFAQLVDEFPADECHIKPGLRTWARRYFADLDRDQRMNLLCQLRAAVGDSARNANAGWFMSTDHLREVSHVGFEVGAHSINHEHLSGLTDEELRIEISESRRLIDKLGADHLLTFCYPFGGLGSWDARCVTALRDNGFACAVSTIEGLNDRRTDVYALRRIRVTGDLPLRAFVFRLLGLRSLVWKLHGIIHRLKESRVT